MSEVARTDPLSVCNASVKQVSAKTANHDLKALKMMFKSAQRDSVITEDPTEFVEPVRKERASKIKRPFGE
jgi:site-specific recombinase XerD